MLIRGSTKNQRAVKQATLDRSATDEPSATDAGDIESIEMDHEELRPEDKLFVQQQTTELDIMTKTLNEEQLKKLLHIDPQQSQAPQVLFNQLYIPPGALSDYRCFA